MESRTKDSLEYLVEDWRNIFSGILSRTFHSRETLLVVALYLVALAWGATYANVVLNHSATTHLFVPTTGILSRYSGWHCGHLLGLACLFTYGIFRLGMGMSLATICSMMIITSPLQLYVLASSPLRDYGRVLQSTALVWCLGRILQSGTLGNRLSLFSAGIGIILGLCLRKNEAILAFLIPSIVILFIAPPFKGSIRRKILSLAVFLFCFLVTAPRPVVRYVPISTTAGIMTAFDHELSLTRPAYDVGYLFLDEYILSTFQLGSGQSGNARFGNPFLRKVYANTPADFLIRIYAAPLQILRFPFLFQLPPPGIQNGVLDVAYALRAAIQRVFGGVGFYMFLATLLLLLSKDLRQGFVFLFLTLFLTTLLTTQFWGRNYIYLEFLPWWCCGFLIQQCIDGFSTGKLKGWNNIFTSQRITKLVRAALILGGGLGFAFISLVVLRRYQEKKLNSLFDCYGDSKVVPVSKDWIQTNKPGVGLMSLSAPLPQGPGEFLMAEFSGSESGVTAIWPVLRYKSRETSRLDWSRTVRIVLPKPGSSTVRYYFPAYSGFEGIELPNDQRAFLKDISWVERAKLPLLMNVCVPPTLGGGVLFQCLDGYGGRRRLSSTRDDLTKEEFDRLMQVPGRPILENDIAEHAAILTINGTEWEVRGYAARPVDPENFPREDRSRSVLSSVWQESVDVSEVDTDLLITNQHHFFKGSFLSIEGEVFVGGLSLGLLKNGCSSGSVTISQPGPFSVILEVQKEGDYSFGIANHIHTYTSLENRFVIKKATWRG